MNKIEEIINNSVYIYSNNTVWDLKRYKYHVCGWEAMDMPDECFVICTLIAESEKQYPAKNIKINNKTLFLYSKLLIFLF